ncbi:MAG TPA: hypothetical protein PKY51_10545 [Fimbriimonadaceae bacterium]|nr:hypothetical protein [Fimbriimonadaceae bacterium]
MIESPPSKGSTGHEHSKPPHDTISARPVSPSMICLSNLLIEGTVRDSELKAYQVLRAMGFSEIDYEPVPNSTPDFLMNGRIGVEIRRLNSIEFEKANEDGLIDSVSKKAGTLLQEYGQPGTQSWWVLLLMKPPVPTWRDLKKKLRNLLQRFLASEERYPGVILEDESLRVEVLPFEFDADRCFLGPDVNIASTGGWAIAEMLEAIPRFAHEKLKKREHCRCHCDEWWLMFEDRISFGLRAQDVSRLRTLLPPIEGWDRVVCFRPYGTPSWIEL